jgi:hypothetical protein
MSCQIRLVVGNHNSERAHDDRLWALALAVYVAKESGTEPFVVSVDR